GGQKARVALARAVYQASDLYILDDTLSAVDSHVGTHIFQNVIGNDGILKGKTRIFALNSINFLSKCDKIIVLKEGNLVDFGTFDELNARKNEAFVELVKELKYKEEHQDDEIDDIETAASVQSQKRNKSSSSKDTKSTPLLETDLKKGKLIKDEKISSEKVAIKIYFGYLKAFGLKLAFGYFIILFIVRTFVESYSQIWMAKWSSNLVNGTKENIENLKIYGFLSISSSIIIGAAFLLIAFGAANASTRLFENLFFSLLRSPITFFDSTPMGRILTRISSDIEQIDFVIPQAIRFLAKLIADCVFYSTLAIYILPELGLFIIPAAYLIANVLTYFTKICVSMRRLWSASSSIITSHTQESYVGATTIRIFGAQKEYCQKMINYTKKIGESKFAVRIACRWSQLIMELIISIFSSVFIISAMYFGHIGILSSSSVALVVSTGTMLKGYFGDIIRETIALESNAVSVERVQEYVENEHEAEWTSSSPPDSNWPTKGHIKLKNFSLRYQPNLPLVLKRLNLEIKSATAAVDIETDHLIQESIRTLFSKCTILTIAHRLNTIMDYDKVLVMDFGEIKEFDSPQKLLSKKDSLFYSLASQAKIV
uniref:ABC transmembrane type-1 domain-containing protein n=2 Tax=Panagrolaimus sp. PS1159 TaxID=55785 RepID=A0AC35FX90_9BILA